MSTQTSRLALQQPVGADNPSTLRTSITSNSNILDNAVTFVSNVFASLSVSLAGRLLRGTDTKRWYVDNGTALDTLLHLGLGPATFRVTNTSSSVKVGEWVIAGGGTTQTLPAAVTADNQFVMIQAETSASGSSPVTVAGSNIYGLGLAGASSFTLGTPQASVILMSQSGNWRIVSGQQDTGWLAVTPATNFSSGGAQARLRGDSVALRGYLQSTAGGSAGISIGTVPSVCRPSVLGRVAIASNEGTFRSDVLADGSIIYGAFSSSVPALTPGSILALGDVIYPL